MALSAMFAVNADTFTVGGVTYSTLSGTNVTVDKGTYSGEIVIPETVTNNGTTYNVTAVAPNVFWNNKNCTSISLPNTLTSIGGYAFCNCSGIKGDLVLPTALTSLGGAAFSGCSGITSVTIPVGVTTWMTSYFSNIPNLTKFIVTPGNPGLSSVDGIIASADGKKLMACPPGRNTAVNLPEGVEEIGDGTFSQCTRIPAITFPNSLKKIGTAILYNCGMIKELKIGPNVVNIGKRAFAFTTGVTSLTVDPANPNYCSDGGVLYTKDKSTLMYVPRSTTQITFPSNLKVIQDEAFYMCRSLNQPAILPEGFTTLEQHGLQGTSFTGIELPESLTALTDYCLGENNKMTYCNLPSKITNIPQYTFWNCNVLEELTIPAAVKSVQAKAFANVRNLPVLRMLPTTPPNTIASAFENDLYGKCKLLVPADSYEAYANHAVWGKFTTIAVDAPESDQANSVALLSFENPSTMLLEDPINLLFKVKNEGNNAITSLSGILTINGNASDEQTISDLNIMAGTTKTLALPLSLKAGEYDMTLVITKVNGVNNPNEKSSLNFKFKITEVTIPANAPQAAYAYFSNYGSIGDGITHVSHWDAATYFELPKLAGMKIIGANIKNLQSTGTKNYKVWFSETLPANGGAPKDNIIAVDQTGTEVKTAFAEPYVIKADKGVYVGFSFDVESSGSSWPVPYCAPSAPVEQSIVWSKDGALWDNLSSYGTLPIILYLEGDIKADAAAADKVMSPAVALKGKSCSIPIQVTNYGTTAVSTIDYHFTVNGQNVTGTASPNNYNYIGQSRNFTISLPTLATAGNYDVVLTIDKVNGNANTLANNAFTFPYSVGDFQTVHRAVMEEHTGTGCGYCPRGTVGMKRMASENPNFIGAAWHRYNSDDPMYPEAAEPVKFTGAPQCMLDRCGKTIDPYYGTTSGFGIAKDYAAACAIFAPADMALEAQWNADSTEISVKTTAHFSYVEPNKGYKIGYMLTLDSLSHPGDNPWKQSNYKDGDDYTGSDDVLRQIYKGGNFDCYSYNHVVIETSGYKGFEGSLPATMEVGKTYTDQRSIKLQSQGNGLTDGSWLKDEKTLHLNVIAMLLDKDGKIRNATEVRAAAATPTGIDAISAQNGQTIYYDLMGRKVQNPQNGIFIKVQNGHASKVTL